MKDLVIIGAGPAGLTAGIYATRAGLDAVVLEHNYVSGGQIINTYEVDNYPGFPGINGFDLAQKMREHADGLGVVFETADVRRVEKIDGGFRVSTDKAPIETKTVIIASGADHSKLGIPGEDTYGGMGVSYCATCDGAFYRGKDVAVIGGGDVAVEDAIFLARACRKVYVVHRRDALRAQKSLQDKLFALDNVEMVWDSNGKIIEGQDGKVSALVVENKHSGETRTLDVSGVFIAVGIVPNSEIFGGLIDQDDKGYLIADETGATSTPGIFAAGDVRAKALRQIATAVGDGANAVSAVERYLNEQ
ncbi:MAG: thioredoxin-disulfide reductase [Eubacteriaceae bacterium]|nr:thioredoxin-disulfide reductase [Eubacteriaceae bacterium]